MPQNLGAFFNKKIGNGLKNTIDRVVDLCYNKTIGSQERQRKWRTKKMIAFLDKK